MNIYTHKHHIVPRHAGGDNSEDNLVELTIEDHAIAHRIRYKLYGQIQDKLAWRMLEGQALMGETLILKSKLGWQAANKNGPLAKGRKWHYNPDNPSERKMLAPDQEIPSGWVLGRGTNTWAKNRDYKNVSLSHRERTSLSLKKSWSEGKIDHRLSCLGNPNGRKVK